MADPKQHVIRLLSAAQSLASGGELKRAQDVLDQAVKIQRGEWSTRVQKIIDDQRNEVKQ